jgi:DNA adenine methylase
MLVGKSPTTVVEGYFPPLAQGAPGIGPRPDIEEYESTFEIDPYSERAFEQSWLAPTESLIARMGAKSQLRTWLVQNFPPCHTYVEPFGGSFKVLLWKPTANKIEIINDIDADLVHFFHWVCHDPKRLVKTINSVPMHEAVILGMRKGLIKQELHGLERAAAFYISNSSAFNAKAALTNYASSPHSLMNIKISEKQVLLVAARLDKVDMRSTDFRRVINSANKDLQPDKYPPGGVFFYLDPPYWGTSGYVSSQGASTFGWKEQVELADYCNSIDEIGNKFIQTNSDHADLMDLYGSFKRPDGTNKFFVVRRDVYYSLAGKGEDRGDAGEFVISNFPLDQKAKQKGLFS